MAIPDPFRNPTGVIPRVRTAFAAGAGVSVPIDVGTPLDPEMDRIISVWHLADLGTTPIVADVTGNTTINAAGNIVIDVDTDVGIVVVEWNDHDWGETEDASWQE